MTGECVVPTGRSGSQGADGQSPTSHPALVQCSWLVGPSRSDDGFLGKRMSSHLLGSHSGFHRDGPNQKMGKAARPHFADDKAEAGGSEVACPRPPGFVAIRSLWIFHIPRLPRELNEQGIPAEHSRHWAIFSDVEERCKTGSEPACSSTGQDRVTHRRQVTGWKSLLASHRERPSKQPHPTCS